MKMDMLRLIGASAVDLPLTGVEGSGPYVLKSSQGLDPPEIVVRLKRTVLEKAVYQGKTAALRQIIALVELHPDWNEGQTPEELRTELYSLLTPRYGNLVRAEIVHDGVVQAYAQGQISKFEAALFSKDPAVQITLDCDYGYLLAPDFVVQEPVQGTIGGIRSFNIQNDGSAPAHFRMGAILQASTNTLTLSDGHPEGQMLQISGINWSAGDKLLIDTRPGFRGVWRGPQGGAYVSVLNNLNAEVSEWMHLYAGDNELRLSVSAFDWDDDVKFLHQPAYWGV